MRRDRRPLLRPARRHRPLPPRARARRLRCGPGGDDAGDRRPRHRRARPRRAAQPRPPRSDRRRPPRGRRRGHPHPGPRRLPARRPRRRAARGRGLRGRHGLPADRRRRAGRGRAPDRGDRRRGGPAGPRLARRPRHPRPRGPRRPRVHADLPPAGRRRRGRDHGRRARPPRLLPAQAGRARGRGLLPVAVVSHRRLQGDADHRPARAVLPRPVRRALRHRARPGPLALLHQHLPELAAGPPVPAHRAQRRDQHRQGQPQLDDGARVADHLRPSSRATSTASSPSAPPTPPTRRPSTRSSSCSTSAGARCRTRSS